MDGIQFVVIMMLIPALAGALPAWNVQPANFTSAVQGENITLKWEYNVDGTFSHAQFSDLKDGGKEKTVAAKSSESGNVVVASDYQERFFVSISDSQTTIKILRAQKADFGKYKLEVINRNLATINSVVKVSVHYPPANTVLTVFPDRSEVLGGSVLYEKCSTDANPSPHIFLLYFNGNFIRNSSSGEFNVTVDSDGVYTCAPINTVGSGDNASFSVTIFDSASTFINGRMTITNKNFDKSLENPASARYQTIKKQFVEAVEVVFKSDGAFHSTDVTRFDRNGRKGTLNIYFVLTFKEAVRTDRKIALLKIAASDGKLGVLDVDPASVMAIRETEEPVLECNLGCRPSHSIESLACSCENKIFGAVIGVLVFIIIGLLIYIFFLRKRSEIESKERSCEMVKVETQPRPPSYEITLTGVKQVEIQAECTVAEESVGETPEIEADAEPIDT
ncbi:uncharacterized protein LOC111341026 isoform X3 [Stylophora pistillata]|uniref:uncharacterized protein LOC111341026 isoform X3 n=1 Tax=Stylophora pistillata TaxID=50429 RepID=UPI000C043564|nr:uncharacterized protein LOC111341026 isoform X3 [Stylophora pistillata]